MAHRLAVQIIQIVISINLIKAMSSFLSHWKLRFSLEAAMPTTRHMEASVPVLYTI
jgi:hypothetical protein